MSKWMKQAWRGMITWKGVAHFLAGVLLSTLVANFTLHFAYAQYEGDFRAQANLIHDELNRRNGTMEALLTSLAGFYQASDTVNDVQFTTFASELLRAYPFVKAAIALRMLNDQERQELRERKREEGYYQFKISEHQDGKLVRARNRNRYLIIDTMEPITPQLGSMLGYDVFTNEILAATINRAVRSGEGAASPITRILDPQGSVLIFKALYRGRYAPTSAYERLKTFDGAIALEVQLTALLNQTPSTAMAFEITLTQPDKKTARTHTHNVSANYFMPTLFAEYDMDLYGQPLLLHIRHNPPVTNIYIMWALLAFLLCGAIYIAVLQVVKQRRLARVHHEEIAEYAARAAFSEENTDPILRIDANGKILYCNKPGEKIASIWKPADSGTLKKEVQAFVSDVLASGKQQEIEARAYGRHYVLKFIPGKAGQYVNIYGRDDTEQKEAQRRILEAKQTAESANKAKGRFLATISHEIRTPLNGVIGMLDILLSRNQPATDRKLTLTAKRSAMVLFEIIEDVLDYSRSDARKMQLDNRVFDLNTLIEDVVANIRETARLKRLDLKVDVEHFPTRIYADDKKLKKILFNLLGNAVKFTDEGYVLLAVHSLRETQTTVTIRIIVEDSGIGIEPAAIKTIFNEFTQQDASTTRRFGGTGLGLAITRQLTHLMKGAIEVDSQPGAGSRFVVEMDLRKSDIEHSAPKEVVEPEKPVATKPDLPVLNVLIAEDHDINQETTEKMLTTLNCRVTVVADGKQAVDAVRGGDFDIVLMDCHMPVMDGFEATRAIREFSSVPVIALTADVTVATQHHCTQCGMNDYMSKPCEREQMQQMLMRWSQAPGKRPARSHPHEDGETLAAHRAG